MTSPIYSPGLEGIVAGETAISTILEGLHYRGYRVEELAEKASFDEVAFLLLHGSLPKADELKAFCKRMSDAAAAVPGNLANHLRDLPLRGSMMDVMRTGASLLAAWDDDTADISPAAELRKAERLVAQLPVVLVTAHRLRKKLPLPVPEAGRSLASNLLWMLCGREPSQRAVRAIDISLILYAEHEFNASTFTARVVASTQSDMHSAVVAAIGALKGPLHGGANEQVLDVLKAVGSAERAEAWIRDALARKVRVMGFGHRVYKSGDPRAAFLKPICAELARETDHADMEQTAEIIERVMREQRPNLPPNADWPSARLYHYLGLDVELYTPLFVVSRVTGWSAHVLEQHANNRIIRPMARYTGPPPRPWVPIEER